MAFQISSALPDKLSYYSDYAEAIDQDLWITAMRLGTPLWNFEARCIEPMFRVSVGGLDNKLSDFARSSEVTDHWVGQVASNFRAADQAFFGQDAMGDLVAYVKEQVLGVKATEALRTAFSLRLLLGIRAGTTYAGQVILRDPFGAKLRGIIKQLPEAVKEIVGTSRDIRGTMGLSKFLTHSKWLTLPKHMAKGAFWATVAIEAGKLPFQFALDIQEYGSKGGNYVAGAIAVDIGAAALRIGGATGGTYAGSVVGGIIGAAIGSIIPVVGTAVGGAAGSIIGGAIGGWFGSVAADWVISKVREPAIEGVAQAIEQASADLKEAAYRVGAFARGQAQAFGDGLAQFVRSVISARASPIGILAQ